MWANSSLLRTFFLLMLLVIPGFRNSTRILSSRTVCYSACNGVSNLILHRESKKGATLIMAITLSTLG